MATFLSTCIIKNMAVGHDSVVKGVNKMLITKTDRRRVKRAIKRIMIRRKSVKPKYLHVFSVCPHSVLKCNQIKICYTVVDNCEYFVLSLKGIKRYDNKYSFVEFLW